jgi:hypothetical protein
VNLADKTRYKAGADSNRARKSGFVWEGVITFILSRRGPSNFNVQL